MMYYTGGYSYILDGADWGKFRKGYTSQMSEILHFDNGRVPISALHPETREQSLAYIIEMTSLKSPYIIDIKYFDEENNNVLVEKLGTRLGNLFEDKVAQCAGAQSWWGLVGTSFIKTFRSALLGLKFLGENRKCCGSVENISVTESHDCKFTEISGIEPCLGLTISQNVKELRKLMVKALTQIIPAASRAVMDEKTQLTSLSLPSALNSFFETSSTEQWMEWDARWKLDDPAFWSSGDKHTFFKKVLHLYDKNHGRESYNEMMGFLGMDIAIFETRVMNGGTRMKDMLQRNIDDIKDAQKKRAMAKNQGAKSFYSIFQGYLEFFRMAKFTRAAMDHHDDFGKNKTFGKNNPNEVVKGHLAMAEIMDEMFDGTCHKWREALWKYWHLSQYSNFPWQADMIYLLSWNNL